MHRDVAAECVAIDTLGDDMESVEPVELKDGETQDDRTAAVGENHSQVFARCEERCDVICSSTRPGQQERTTAALTLASLLALANVGELSVQQAEPFSASMKLDALRVSSYLRGVQDGKALLVHIGPAQRASGCITWFICQALLGGIPNEMARGKN